jgi:hypothetical protein
VKYSALIFSHQSDSTGDRFSTEALAQMARQATGKPLLLDFDAQRLLGKVVEGAATEAGCAVVADSSAELPEGVRFAPSGQVKASHMEGGVRVITEFDLHSIGVVWTHADPHVPAAERVKRGTS